MFSSGVDARRALGIRLSGAAIATAALLVALPAAASAAVSPPTLSSAFTPASIGSGGTTALSFTITNPNPSGTLNAIAFTDTLPAGVVVDNPNGLTGTCGSASTLTGDAGSSTIALTGGKLAAGATCTLQVSVTSTTPGNYQNSTGQVSSTEGGAGNGDTQPLTVFGLPTVSVTNPKENAVYSFGQQVIAGYTCHDAFGAPGLSDCSGDADSGTAIDTSTDGANTFSVSAISNDGAITTQTIDYTVLPDNRFTVSKLTGHTGGQVTFKVKLPDVGKLTATLLRQRQDARPDDSQVEERRHLVGDDHAERRLPQGDPDRAEGQASEADRGQADGQLHAVLRQGREGVHEHAEDQAVDTEDRAGGSGLASASRRPDSRPPWHRDERRRHRHDALGSPRPGREQDLPFDRGGHAYERCHHHPSRRGGRPCGDRDRRGRRRNRRRQERQPNPTKARSTSARSA